MVDQVTQATERRERTLWHVRVSPRMASLDGHGREVLSDVHEIGLRHFEAVQSSRLFFFLGNLNADDIRFLGERLLADPVAEVFSYGPELTERGDKFPTGSYESGGGKYAGGRAPFVARAGS